MDPTEELQQLLQKIADYKLHVLKSCEEMANAFGGTYYPLDSLAMGAAKRSINLTNGFRTLIDSYNLECATAILRLQLDNALRFYAAFLVKDPHDFARKIMKGEHVRRLYDANNNKLTDKFLVDQLSKEFEWVKPVYDTACSFIHLSDRHIFSTVKDVNSKERTVEVAFGNINADEPIERYIETAHAYLASTKLFIIHLDGWVETKKNPPGFDESKTT